MDTSMHTQKPCSGGTIELNHIVYISTTNPLNTGECKSWTLDSGLDHGLDYGLEYGLNSRRF